MTRPAWSTWRTLAFPSSTRSFPTSIPNPGRSCRERFPTPSYAGSASGAPQRGIKGKYSLIPHPACAGWLDRDLPGWSKQELKASLELVRTLMAPNWDIHPEMVSHTWAIDTRTGRPFPERTSAFMENWGDSAGKSADQLADYMSYALKILKNVGMVCDGITTPGGFGTHVLPELAQGTLEACRDVFRAEIPHYFRHLYTDGQSVAPRVQYASELGGPEPRCVVSIIGCTGDWFGGWDGLTVGSVDRFITADSKGGRLPEVIARGEPAVLVCHWPGMYFNGAQTGFTIFKEVVRRLDDAYDGMIWMKLSELALLGRSRADPHRARPRPGQIVLEAPFACPKFTIQVDLPGESPGILTFHMPPGGDRVQETLSAVASLGQIKAGAFHAGAGRLVICLDLPKGSSRLELAHP